MKYKTIGEIHKETVAVVNKRILKAVPYTWDKKKKDWRPMSKKERKKWRL